MLRDLRDIRAKKIKENIEEYNRLSTLLGEIEKEEKEYENEPKVEVKEFTFWQKVFKPKEYEEYLKQVQQDKKLRKRYQKIKLKEEKADLQKQIDSLDINNLKRLYEKTLFAQTLKDLDLNLEEAKEILKENQKDCILDLSDKVPINREYKKLKDISNYVLITKISYAPNNGKIETPKNIGDKEKSNIILNGKNYEYEYNKEINTIRFTINDEQMYKTERENLEKKYAIIINLKDIDKEKIKVLSPVNTIVDGNLEIPKGSYIICPKNELNEIRVSNKDINVIGYVGDNVNGYARSFISMLGYRIEKLDVWSWINPLAQEDFIEITSEFGFNINNKDINFLENEHINLNINKYIGIMKMIENNNLLKNNTIEDIINELIKKDILQLTTFEIIIKELLSEQYKGLMQLYEKLEESGYDIKEEYKKIILNIMTIPAYKKIDNDMVFGKKFKEEKNNKEFVSFLKNEIIKYDSSINLPYQLVGVIITYLVLETIKNK